MTQQRYEGVMVDHCHKCGGTWLDHGEIEQIVADQTSTFDEQAKIKAVAAKGKDHRAPKNLRCPKCQSVMEKFQYMFNSGVYIDRCSRGHGIYFDHGELEKVQIVMEEALLRTGNHSTQIAETAISGQKVCPRDGVALREVTYETERIDRCDRCGGVWCDLDELGQTHGTA
jgi:Zn-finger nucleic acid-binding protein